MASFALCAFLCIILAAGTLATLPGRVVGGVDASEGQFPHQISLRKNGSHNCGGSIISRNYILTAAHCVGTINLAGIYTQYDPSILSVRAGSNNRLSGGVLLYISEVKTHENYGLFLNDVALLKLEKPLIYSQNIQPIRVATKEVPSGAAVIISGWGRIKQGGDIPQKLQWNTLYAISRSECDTAMNWGKAEIICLAHEPNNGACNGDSGGPAVYDDELVGIAGFVYTGCATEYPDGYAKVYYHYKWIKANSDA